MILPPKLSLFAPTSSFAGMLIDQCISKSHELMNSPQFRYHYGSCLLDIPRWVGEHDPFQKNVFHYIEMDS